MVVLSEVVVVFTIPSSLLFASLLLEVNANNMTTNTGNNKSRNGDTLVNFFMVLRFKV